MITIGDFEFVFAQYVHFSVTAQEKKTNNVLAGKSAQIIGTALAQKRQDNSIDGTILHKIVLT